MPDLKRAAFFSILVLIPLVAIELGCLVFAKVLKYELFSYEREYMASITETDFTKFVQSVYFDPVIGWNNPVPWTKAFRKNCVGNVVEYNYVDGYRVTPGVRQGDEEIALFGESFTQGEEADDAATISAVLAGVHGLATVNYGVNAYDPLQAVEKFKATLRQRARLKTAVLLVMHENIWRVVNSFKPVYFPGMGGYAFGLKPYVENDQIVAFRYPAEYAAFLQEAHQRFKRDFWAKPERSFPYTLSVANAMSSNKMASMFWGIVRGPFVDEYDHNSQTRNGLAIALTEFVRTADAAQIRPAIIFIPRNESTYRVSENFVQTMNERWGRNLAHEFRDDEMDWKKYKISTAYDYCHPSVYGYGRLAGFVGSVIRSASELKQVVK